MPAIEHNGCLWRAMEDTCPEIKRGRDFRALVLSAPADSSSLNNAFGGWLEGNAAVAPDGSVVDLPCVDYRKRDGEYAAIVRTPDDKREASFSPDNLALFPGGRKKYTICRDPADRTYLTLWNAVAPENRNYHVARARHPPILVKSRDARD